MGKFGDRLPFFAKGAKNGVWPRFPFLSVFVRGHFLPEACETRDAGRLVVALKEIVLDYSPSAHLLKRVIPARAVLA